jgi:inner membrane protein involved in colicin E2 resistance
VQDLRFWVFLLASLLGLIFLLLVPLHINNIVQQSNETFQQINQKATQAETQIQNETQQVNALLKDEQKLSELEKAIESGQIPGNQLPQAQLLRQQLQTFKKDPNALNKQVEAAKNKIRTEKQNAENETKTGALKLGLRTGLSSLLLAIGYIVIGWTGFRSLGSSSVSRR